MHTALQYALADLSHSKDAVEAGQRRALGARPWPPHALSCLAHVRSRYTQVGLGSVLARLADLRFRQRGIAGAAGEWAEVRAGYAS